MLGSWPASATRESGVRPIRLSIEEGRLKTKKRSNSSTFVTSATSRRSFLYTRPTLVASYRTTKISPWQRQSRLSMRRFVPTPSRTTSARHVSRTSICSWRGNEAVKSWRADVNMKDDGPQYVG